MSELTQPNEPDTVSAPDDGVPPALAGRLRAREILSMLQAHTGGGPPDQFTVEMTIWTAIYMLAAIAGAYNDEAHRTSQLERYPELLAHAMTELVGRNVNGD